MGCMSPSLESIYPEPSRTGHSGLTEPSSATVPPLCELSLPNHGLSLSVSPVASKPSSLALLPLTPAGIPRKMALHTQRALSNVFSNSEQTQVLEVLGGESAFAPWEPLIQLV